MKRLALAFATASLAACATPPEQASSAAQPQALQPPAVSLEVIEDYAAESVGVLKSPYVGQPVVLEAERAIDPAGRLCKTPQYWESQTSAEIILNKPPQPQAAHDPAPRTALSVTCGNAPFLALVSQPDGSWLTRQGAWVLRVAAELNPERLPPETLLRLKYIGHGEHGACVSGTPCTVYACVGQPVPAL